MMPNIFVGTYKPSLLKRKFVYNLFNFVYKIGKWYTNSSSLIIRWLLNQTKKIPLKSIKDIRQPFLYMVNPVLKNEPKYVYIKNILGAWIGLEKFKESQHVIIYIHGGGFISGDISGFISIVDKLSDEFKCPVFIIQYSLLPENSFENLYVEIDITINYVNKKLPRKHIYLFGDSAGCGAICFFFERVYNKKNG